MKKDKLIIGGSIESMLFAWRMQTPILIKDLSYVYRHNKILNEFDLSFINASDAKELQRNLFFALSFASLNMYSGRVQNINVEESIVKVSTEGNKMIEIECDEIIQFDQKTNLFDVYDFFDMRSASRHNIKRLEDDSNFIYQLDFYNSPRTTQGDHFDVVGASRMTSKELLSADYSQGIAMLKIKRMLAQAGVKGPFSWEKNGVRYYKQIKMEFYKREVSEILETKLSFEEIYNLEQTKGEAWKMLEKLRIRERTLLE